jgi:uncharacterized Zn finger protein
VIENCKAMMCGGCGNEDFRIYRSNDNSMYTHCMSCDSITELTTSPPKIELNWVGNSIGVLCPKP